MMPELPTAMLKVTEKLKNDTKVKSITITSFRNIKGFNILNEEV